MEENIRHGKLVTIKKVQKSQKKPHIPAKWLCKCDCGNEKIIHECNLYGRGVKSCGCVGQKRFGQDRFNKNFIQDRVDINEKDCWVWRGAKHRQGYGNVRFRGKTFLAHRISWIIFNEEISEQIKVCHKCDNPPCCNPEHLFLGSQKDNMEDANQKKRMNGRKLGKRRNKLNWDQVQQIKKLHGEGMSRENLREKYGVGQTCIAKILTGKSWNINWTQEQ